MVGSSGDLRCFRPKKNLTEINHKVSVIAKWLWWVFAAVFAAKCTPDRSNPG
jgi:hypothetical protein